jgi:uncharacterized membrane protein YdbT with pleckstrin-like domain
MVVFQLTSNSRQLAHGDVVWAGKPWITPAVIIRTVTVIVVTIPFLWLELYFGAAFTGLVGLPIWAWTFLAFSLIWLISMLEILVFRASNTYTLRQDGLEIKRGIIRLHSFVVTPSGFGDLSVYQSIGGRIFGFGDLIVNSQGERETKLRLVRHPFKVADTLRDIMGKPIVRVEGRI